MSEPRSLRKSEAPCGSQQAGRAPVVPAGRLRVGGILRLTSKKDSQKARPAFAIPDAIIDEPEVGSTIEGLKPGEFAWGRVLADRSGLPFVLVAARLLSFQNAERAPHFLIVKEDGSVRTRLMNQRVQRVDWGLRKSYGVLPITEVEL
jgi:hypothetical protein